MARALHRSDSSLQRHLAAEDTSFQTIKNALRRDVAIFRLNTSDVPLGRLAAELGFSESSSFQRAFKGWTGCAPGVNRRIGLGQAGTARCRCGQASRARANVGLPLCLTPTGAGWAQPGLGGGAQYPS